MIITTRRQKQLIRNALAGIEPDIDPASLSPDFLFLYDGIIKSQSVQDAYAWLFRVKVDDPPLAGLVDEILSLEAGKRRQYSSLAQIGPDLPDVKWLWTDWIPRGMLSLLAAEPGVGKTNVALDIANRIIGGQSAPDNSEFNVLTGNVIYVDAENFLNVIYSRARAWGMDMSKLYPFQPPQGEQLDLNSTDYQETLWDMCYDLQPDLVIIDSLSSVNLKGENNVEDLREVLSFLVDLSEGFNLALVLIHHLRKPKQGQSSITMHDLRGSGHLTAMARSILGLYIQSDDRNGPRRLKVLKTNLTKHPRPLLCGYVPSATDPEIAMLSYDMVDIPAETLPDNLTGRCAEWLLDCLADGPISYSDLCDLGSDHHEPPWLQNTIQNARAALDWQIVDTKGPKVKGNQWALHTWLDEDSSENITWQHTWLDEAAKKEEFEGKSIHTWSHEPCDTPPAIKFYPPPITWLMRPCDNIRNKWNVEEQSVNVEA